MGISKSSKEAKRRQAQLRRDDIKRTGKFLCSQYDVVSNARQELQDAIEERDEKVTNGENAAEITVAQHVVNTKQQTMGQAEEILRIRERKARRLYPEDFHWLG